MKDVVILTGMIQKRGTSSHPIGKEDTTPSGKPIFPEDFTDPSYQPAYRLMGAYQIAHALREAEISTQVIDYIQYMTEDGLTAYIEKFIHKDKVSIVGVSTTFITNDGKMLPDHVLGAIKRIKQKYPDIKIVLGGAIAHKFNLKENLVDYAIASYAEDVTIELFSGLLGKTKLNPDFKLNKKIIKYNTEYDITKCQHRFTDDDCIRPGESLPLEISRGCIFSCSFCRFPFIGKKKNDYIRDMELVKEEILYNYEKWGVTNYYLLDDTFNESPEKVSAFCDMIKSLPFKIHWTAYLRLDLIHRFPETAVMMKESGLRSAFFGIESFHPQASKIIGKGWNGKPEAKPFLKDLRDNIWGDDVRITCSLIAGLPPEDEDSLKETQKFLRENRIHASAWHLLAIKKNPSLDSSLFEKDPAKYGFTLSGSDDWHNGHHSRSQVLEWYKKLVIIEEDNYYLKRHTSWVTIEALNYMSIEEIIECDPEVVRPKFVNGRRDFLSQYFNLLNNINK